MFLLTKSVVLIIPVSVIKQTAIIITKIITNFLLLEETCFEYSAIAKPCQFANFYFSALAEQVITRGECHGSYNINQ